jgi:hypothetical protein
MGRRAGTNATINAVIYKVGDTWHAQCLEHDIAARAKTPQDLSYALQRAIAAHQVIAGDDLAAVPPAPAFFRQMFERGLKLEHPEHLPQRKRSAFAEVRLSETLAPA